MPLAYLLVALNPKMLPKMLKRTSFEVDLQTVRAVFEAASTTLPSTAIGHTDSAEDQEQAARSSDGVLKN